MFNNTILHMRCDCQFLELAQNDWSNHQMALLESDFWYFSPVGRLLEVHGHICDLSESDFQFINFFIYDINIDSMQPLAKLNIAINWEQSTSYIIKHRNETS